MTKLLHQYHNGNYEVELYSDGTKVRKTEEQTFISAFPENIDIKITNYCDAGCAFCHENSTTEGLHGEIDWAFFETLRPGTELAIGGGNPLSHPKLKELLTYIREKDIVANLTINQMHFQKSIPLIDELVAQGLVKGIGVSLMRVNDALVEQLKRYEHAVVHVIHGVVRFEELQKLFGHGLKLLVLGYKYLRRGKQYFDESVTKRQEMTHQRIHDIIKGFEIVSFDNLGIGQLDVKRLFTRDEWDQFYMGDDGQFTMYIDLVEGQYALSSTSLTRHKLTEHIDDMFKQVKKESIA